MQGSSVAAGEDITTHHKHHARSPCRSCRQSAGKAAGPCRSAAQFPSCRLLHHLHTDNLPCRAICWQVGTMTACFQSESGASPQAGVTTSGQTCAICPLALSGMHVTYYPGKMRSHQQGCKTQPCTPVRLATCACRAPPSSGCLGELSCGRPCRVHLLRPWPHHPGPPSAPLGEPAPGAPASPQTP